MINSAVVEEVFLQLWTLAFDFMFLAYCLWDSALLNPCMKLSHPRDGARCIEQHEESLAFNWCVFVLPRIGPNALRCSAFTRIVRFIISVHASVPCMSATNNNTNDCMRVLDASA